MNKWGYSRVSTIEQDLDIQHEWLLKQGVVEDRIFAEKISGSELGKRTKLQELMKSVTSGDTIYVYKLDRLARNTVDSLAIMEELRGKHVGLIFGDIGSIEDNLVGNLVYTIFSAVAEMERKRIIERTQAGRQYQRDHNPDYREGRPAKLTPNQVANLVKRSKTESKAELARSYNVSRKSVYRYLARYSGNQEEVRL
jgi:DNA invertase Pin-like site-specific DNA recombinase